jgi:branched-chain amino acid transport system ATP-binding protein
MTKERNAMALLETKNVTKTFGGLTAVDGLDLSIDKGEIFGLIGPNGAGKTTVFNLVSGMLRCTRGKVFYGGEDITGLSMYEIAAKGLVRTFQLPTLFTGFTVLKNVLLGLHLRAEEGFWKCLVNTSSTRRRESEILARANEILQEVGLAERKDELASNLPHGHRRSLQVAISLGCEPGLLLLDEPFTGMNVDEVKGMMGLIKKLKENRGITIVIVEHNVKAMMDLCDRIGVLNFGKKIAQGTPTEISQDEGVIRAYLGEPL